MNYVRGRRLIMWVLLLGMVASASSAMARNDDYYEALRTYIRQYTAICQNSKGEERANQLAHLKQKYDHLVYLMTADGRQMLARFGKATESCADGAASSCTLAAELSRTLLTLVDDVPRL